MRADNLALLDDDLDFAAKLLVSPILHHEADPYGAGDDVKPFGEQPPDRF